VVIFLTNNKDYSRGNMMLEEDDKAGSDSTKVSGDSTIKDSNSLGEWFSSNAVTILWIAGICLLIVGAIMLPRSNSSEPIIVNKIAQESPVKSTIDYIEIVHALTKIEKKNIVDNGDIQGNGYHTMNVFDQRFYVFNDGSIIINSILVDKNGLIDVTSSASNTRKEVYQKIKSTGFPMVSRGQGDAEFIIFTDPDCPVCQRFEKEVDMDGIVANTVFIPLDKIHPQSRAHIADIMATGNPSVAMTDFMVNKMSLPAHQVESKYPFEQALKFAGDAMVLGTPTIITPDGSVIPFLNDHALMKRMIKAHQ